MKKLAFFVIGTLSLPFILAHQIGLALWEMFEPTASGITDIGREVSKKIRERGKICHEKNQPKRK